MMSSSDAIIWNIEKDPLLQSTVMAVWILDQAPTDERMSANIDRMVAAIPRLRQRVAPGKPRPLWDPIDDLDLDDHYVTEALPSDSTLDDVLDYAQAWVREPFDRDRPLWKLGLLTGLEDGKAAIVIKVHHAIADGMGMVLMLAAFTDMERDPARIGAGDTILEVASDRPVFNPVKRIAVKALRGARTLAGGPIDAIADTAAVLKSSLRLVTPHRTPHSKLMTQRSGELFMETRAVDLDAFRQVATAEAVSVNDVFVSLLSDALTDYHEQMGIDCPELRVHMPVDTRFGREANVAGNQFVPARISLDVRAEPGATRRSHIALQLETLRAEPALGHINTVSAAIQRLGRPISRFIIGGMMKGVDVLASNVQGPNFPLFLAGGKIEQFYAFGPPAGAALNVTMFSYDGIVGMALTIDGAAITDRPLFRHCLDRVIDLTFATPAIELAAS